MGSVYCEQSLPRACDRSSSVFTLTDNIRPADTETRLHENLRAVTNEFSLLVVALALGDGTAAPVPVYGSTQGCLEVRVTSPFAKRWSRLVKLVGACAETYARRSAASPAR